MSGAGPTSSEPESARPGSESGTTAVGAVNRDARSRSEGTAAATTTPEDAPEGTELFAPVSGIDRTAQAEPIMINARTTAPRTRNGDRFTNARVYATIHKSS